MGEMWLHVYIQHNLPRIFFFRFFIWYKLINRTWKGICDSNGYGDVWSVSTHTDPKLDSFEARNNVQILPIFLLQLFLKAVVGVHLKIVSTSLLSFHIFVGFAVEKWFNLMFECHDNPQSNKTTF